MPLPQVTTTDYPEGARKRLGVAVTRAREAAGWMRRKDLAEQAKISVRSLAKLEGGDPGVGRLVLEAVGRSLPQWTEDTPWSVLDGDDPPPTTPPTAAEVEPPEEEELPWTEEDEKVYDALAAVVGHDRLRLRVVRAMQEEAARREAERNDVAPPTRPVTNGPTG